MTEEVHRQISKQRDQGSSTIKFLPSHFCPQWHFVTVVSQSQILAFCVGVWLCTSTWWWASDGTMLQYRGVRTIPYKLMLLWWGNSPRDTQGSLTEIEQRQSQELTATVYILTAPFLYPFHFPFHNFRWWSSSLALLHACWFSVIWCSTQSLDHLSKICSILDSILILFLEARYLVIYHNRQIYTVNNIMKGQNITSGIQTHTHLYGKSSFSSSC